MSEDINGTFTACGGDVTFWKLKKFWYLTDNLMIMPLLLLCIASVTTLKETLAFCIFFSTSTFVPNFVYLREIIAGYDIDESYNYVQHVI